MAIRPLGSIDKYFEILLCYNPLEPYVEKKF
jgi:hypothetical protein